MKTQHTQMRKIQLDKTKWHKYQELYQAKQFLAQFKALQIIPTSRKVEVDWVHGKINWINQIHKYEEGILLVYYENE